MTQLNRSLPNKRIAEILNKVLYGGRLKHIDTSTYGRSSEGHYHVLTLKPRDNYPFEYERRQINMETLADHLQRELKLNICIEYVGMDKQIVWGNYYTRQYHKLTAMLLFADIKLKEKDEK